MLHRSLIELRVLLFLIFFAIKLFFSINSFSFGMGESEMHFGSGFNQDIKPLQVTGESIKWEIFAKTKEKMECTIDPEGFDNCLIKPIYSSQIRALNNKKVTITGFMFPLDPTDKQKNFLIGPYPASCPFNYHVSPSQIVEVKLQKGIAFSYDPVTVKGILSLKYNKETGVFYYLHSI
jgi:hypothetical protein